MVIEAIMHHIGAPVGTTKQVLKVVRIDIATDFGQLPTLFAFCWTEQSSKLYDCAIVDLGTGEAWCSTPYCFFRMRHRACHVLEKGHDQARSITNTPETWRAARRA